MTEISTYVCDICKETTQDEYALAYIRIQERTRVSEKHAHKECLIKVGLLTEPEPLKIEPNVFLSLAEGATSASEDKAFLDTEEGPQVGKEPDDNDD